MINGSLGEKESYVRCGDIDKAYNVAVITHKHIPAVMKHSRGCVAGECN
jgi:hypothetical protein